MDGDFEKPLHANERSACIAVQEPVVAPMPETCGQHVLYEQLNEVCPFDSTGTTFPTLAITVGKGHRFTIIGNQLPVADHAPVQVAGEIFQCRLHIPEQCEQSFWSNVNTDSGPT